MPLETYTIASNAVRAKITGLGAAIASLKTVDPRTGSTVELMGQWPSSTGGMTSGFLMGPVVGLVSKSGKVVHDGETFEPGKHGYARSTVFGSSNYAPGGNSITLVHDHEPNKIYPFRHRMEVDYHITERELAARWRITNRDTRDMPFGGGFHPAFLWPLSGSANKPEHTLSLAAALPEGTNVYRPVDGRLSASATDLSPFDKQGAWGPKPEDFANDAFFFITPPNDRPATQSLTFNAPNSPGLKIVMENWDGFGVWSKPQGSFLCIEPCVGVPLGEAGDRDAPQLSAVRGLRTLKPGETFSAVMKVALL